MAVERNVRPLARCMQATRHDRLSVIVRTFTATASPAQELTTETQDAAAPPSTTTTQGKVALDPNIIQSPRAEHRLQATQRRHPIGSRRRRAAIATSQNIPFSQLPYQCFQEARKFLQEARADRVQQIEVQRQRLERLKAQSVPLEDEHKRETRMRSMLEKLEELKILADISDPIVKKNFEDGHADMNKPIYRHLSELKWRSYKRKVLMQRIEQMTVVPDILPSIDPVVSSSLAFGRRNVPHGDIVDSRVSEFAPRLNLQPYDAGERLVTIAVVNPDVPDVSKDGFSYRCHFLASNISISPTSTQVDLSKLSADSQIIQDWLPPFAQKGLSYQRLGIFILQQSSSSHHNTQPLDVATVKEKGRYTKRENFILRSLVDKFDLKPVGVDLFRTRWDDGTEGVMRRAGVPGGDVEFKRKKIEPLPYKRLKSERYR